MNTPKRLKECLSRCREEVGATGCEANWGNIHRGCIIHRGEVKGGSGMTDQFFCWPFSKCVEGKLDILNN